MRLIILMIFTLALNACARAGETPPPGYYAQQMKSCEYTVRETWRDYLLYAPHKRLDECCAESVRAMEAANARRLPPGGQCPENSTLKSLDCGTGKNWCE